MFNANNTLIAQAMARGATQPVDEDQEAIRFAIRLYDQTCTRGQLRRLWSMLTRRTSQLLDLSQVEASCAVRERCYAGIQTVPLQQIRGSACRSHDFDSTFHPRQGHNRSRWLNIAVARQMGVMLPPVELIRVGDVYFVQDGHHRIPVARGQTCIEAAVVVWQVIEPPPWQQPAAARRRTSVPTQQGMRPIGTS